MLSAKDRANAITLRNGWRGFRYPFLLPEDHATRTFGMDGFSRSGKPNEIYLNAGFDPASLQKKILSAL